MGLGISQISTIYQRRSASFAVSSQKITSTQSKRIAAWHPNNGFPQPSNPANRQTCPPGLAVYILRTEDDEFWAGWFQDSSPCRDKGATALLANMLPNSPEQGHAGFISFPSNTLFIDESDATTPFFTVTTKVPTAVTAKVPTDGKPKPVKKQLKPRIRSEEEITNSLFEEDEDVEGELEEELKEVIQKVRKRNTKAINDLKELYNGECQLTGFKYSFKKKDGNLYCEAHHLLPLGNEGADSPFNIIIVNPLIHRMLHYADVTEFNLSEITEEHTLDIKINNESHTITWHPDHAKSVKKHQQKE